MIKLLYFCSFVPARTLQAAGYEMICACDLPVNAISRVFPGNLCRYVRCCEALDYSAFDGVIFTNCCNAIQRLYDRVCAKHPYLFTYILELPRSSGRIQRPDELFTKLEQHFGLPVKTDAALLTDILSDDGSTADITVFSTAMSRQYEEDLLALFSEYSIQIETCHSKARGDAALLGETHISCPRLMNYSAYAEQILQRAKAVIFIGIANCDQALFAYPLIRTACQNAGKQCLYVEEEYTELISERSRLRYEAFRECISLC